MVDSQHPIHAATRAAGRPIELGRSVVLTSSLNRGTSRYNEPLAPRNRESDLYGHKIGSYVTRRDQVR